ncbi:MAG: flap structure-specific endonuclease [Deltaproteobacteria bacterium]|nr:flap structure-specific endonuclease [Deltaproteobacteria bacterium]
MGINLTSIIVKEVVEFKELRGKHLAIGGTSELHQSLTLIRKEDATPLTNAGGNITTSLLAGLFYRTTRLLREYGIRPVLVFDGTPPVIGSSKTTMTSKSADPMIEDAKRLLKLLGIPYVEAPGDGEAQAAYMAKKGDVWATHSKDYDSILFGTPRFVRYLTLSRKGSSQSRFIPSQPEVIDTFRILSHCGISLKQLIDMAILMGTDYNQGIKGIGPKTALRLIRQYGSLEELPLEIAEHLPENYQQIREVFLEPEVTTSYSIDYKRADEEGLYQFLCSERGFAEERVKLVIEGIKG